MSNNNLEIVHEGWLIKSPPTKRILRARWRRRWFVLRQSGELPGQYLLEYYTDQSCRKLKGQIDLDQCDQVDAGLQIETRKQKYQFMFDVRTPHRIYYLAAESEPDMNKWVDCVCQVCGLKASSRDDDYNEYMPPETGSGIGQTFSLVTIPESTSHRVSEDDVGNSSVDGSVNNNGIGLSPPGTPTSTSDQYIPISECLSGRYFELKRQPNGMFDFDCNASEINAQLVYNALLQSKSQILMKQMSAPEGSGSPKSQIHHSRLSQPPLPPQKGLSMFMRQMKICDDFYDQPRQLHPPKFNPLPSESLTPPLHSPLTDVESVFTDEEWTGANHLPAKAVTKPLPSVNWETYPRDDNRCLTWSVRSASQRMANITVTKQPSSSPESAARHRPRWTSSLGRRVPLTSSGRARKGTVADAMSAVHPGAPPRPPKPSRLLNDTNSSSSHNYLNIETAAAAFAERRTRPTQELGKGNSFRDDSDADNSSSGTPASSQLTPNTPVSPKDTDLPSSSVALINDETYDFPRSHQESLGTLNKGRRQHCYTNAAPGQVNGNVFRYDFPPAPFPATGGSQELPLTPRSFESGGSLSSPVAIYSNLPSPHGHIAKSHEEHPPAVNRTLKPKRKLSDTNSTAGTSGSELSPGTPNLSNIQISPVPPSVDRRLKPQRRNIGDYPPEDVLKLCSPPASRHGTGRKTRAAPSPTPPGSAPGTLRRSANSCSEGGDKLYIPSDDPYGCFPPARRLSEIQYLDLALDSESGAQSPRTPDKAPLTTTVYKTVDFVKTEAFNRTRQTFEEARKNTLPDSH